MDFIIGLPLVIYNGSEIDVILIIINRFLKAIRLFAVKTNMTFIKLIELFYNEIELEYKAFNSIVLDKGFIFISAF